MSSASPQPAPTASPAPGPPPVRELRIYGHTPLFYWWPVWACGYIMAIATLWQDDRVAIVPSDSYLVEGEETLIRLPQGKVADPSGVREVRGQKVFKERMHPSKNLGIIFTVVLIVVILITNMPLRGLSSAIAVTVILLITVIFAWQNWWAQIFEWLDLLNIHMNAGFYVFFSTVLLVAWVLVFFVYDRLWYWRVTPGEITQQFVFGGGQRAFATDAMTFEKLRDDLFRHWVLGLGSGDLIMHPLVKGGASEQELAIHNVLFVGTKIRKIQELIATRPEKAGG
jgi:uncharacterized membrane protein YkgB